MSVHASLTKMFQAHSEHEIGGATHPDFRNELCKRHNVPDVVIDVCIAHVIAELAIEDIDSATACLAAPKRVGDLLKLVEKIAPLLR